jgi:hypothetical protein
VVAFVETP